MATLAEVAAEAPGLVEEVRSLIGSCPNAVLGTYRADGSLRLSGIDPQLVDGEIVVGSMAGARKLADLRRDPRLAVHTVPWESRRVREGAELVEADAKLDGRAVETAGPETETETGTGTGTGTESPAGAYFRVEVDRLSTVRVTEREGTPCLEIALWTPGGGLRVTHRS